MLGGIAQIASAAAKASVPPSLAAIALIEPLACVHRNGGRAGLPIDEHTAGEREPEDLNLP